MNNASESGKHLICARLITEERLITPCGELLSKSNGDHRIVARQRPGAVGQSRDGAVIASKMANRRRRVETREEMHEST
jgi:hypothetical protein